LNTDHLDVSLSVTVLGIILLILWLVFAFRLSCKNYTVPHLKEKICLFAKSNFLKFTCYCSFSKMPLFDSKVGQYVVLKYVHGGPKKGVTFILAVTLSSVNQS